MADDIENDYVTRRIPKDLIETIKLIIEKTDLGYRNPSEFIVESVRNNIKGIFNLYPDLKLEFESKRKK